MKEEGKARDRGGKDEWVDDEAMEYDGIHLDEKVPVTDRQGQGILLADPEPRGYNDVMFSQPEEIMPG